MEPDKCTDIIKILLGPQQSSVLLHGPGGCGKSYTIRLLYKKLRALGKKVSCTATTGIAALNLSEGKIKTRTLHSWAGVGLARESSYKLVAKIKANFIYRRRWQDVQVLIIDEVSMLGASFFKKLDAIARAVRNKDEPFGGIRLVVSGDFLQLPPVKDTWIFETQEWKDLCIECVAFTDPKRYDDMEYFQSLLRIRRGGPSKADFEMLQERVDAYDQYLLEEMDDDKITVKPTLLYSRKRNVEAYNSSQLQDLPAKEESYTGEDFYKSSRPNVRREKYELMLDDAIKKTIILKVGAQVMLKANLDVDDGLVNGSRGVVTETGIGYVDVKFRGHDEDTRITPHTWSVEDDDMNAARTQIPLILAWAATIHKSQGCTIDFAVCDIGSSVFEDGQAYVALSRVRNRAGLFLSDLHEGAIVANEAAVRYVNAMETEEVKFLIRFTAPHTQKMLKKTMFKKIEDTIMGLLTPNSHVYIYCDTIIDQIPIVLHLKDVIKHLSIVGDKLPKIVAKIPSFKKNVSRALGAGVEFVDSFIADKCIIIDWGEQTVAANQILEQYNEEDRYYIDLLK